MWSTDRLRQFCVRAAVDVVVLLALGVLVVTVLWAYHGQVAYNVIQNSIAAQQKAQQGK